MKVSLLTLALLGSLTSGFQTPARLLNLIEEKHFKPFKEFTISHMGLQPGSKVIEVGPGPQASEIVMIPEIIGPEGQYIGIEGNHLDAGIANLKAQQAGVDNVSKIIYHLVQPGSPLPFKDGTFDVAYASRVLCHIDNHKYVLNEMVRVLKEGGVLVTTCHDSSSFSSNLFSLNEESILKSSQQTDHPYPESFEFSKNSLKDFLDMGLTDRTIASWPLLETELLGKEYHEELQGLLFDEVKRKVGEKLANQKLQELRDLLDSDSFYFSLNFILTRGVKPENWESREEKEEIKEFSEEHFLQWRNQIFAHLEESKTRLEEVEKLKQTFENN